MIKAPIRILIVAALCLTALIALVWRENGARASGTEILMAMEAVDPRALLAGHYVTISLQERLPAGEPCPAGVEGYGGYGEDQSWVSLSAWDGAYHVVGQKRTRAEASGDTLLAVRGDANCFMQPGVVEAPAREAVAPNVAEPSALPEQAVVSAMLGAERFYIGQAEAERIERVLRDQEPGEQRAFAILSIGADGVARLKGLVIDGERLETKLF